MPSGTRWASFSYTLCTAWYGPTISAVMYEEIRGVGSKIPDGRCPPRRAARASESWRSTVQPSGAFTVNGRSPSGPAARSSRRRGGHPAPRTACTDMPDGPRDRRSGAGPRRCSCTRSRRRPSAHCAPAFRPGRVMRESDEDVGGVECVAVQHDVVDRGRHQVDEALGARFGAVETHRGHGPDRCRPPARRRGRDRSRTSRTVSSCARCCASSRVRLVPGTRHLLGFMAFAVILPRCRRLRRVAY